MVNGSNQHAQAAFRFYLVLLLFSPLASAAWTIRDLGTLGGEYSVATDINSLGQVTGYSLTPPHLHNNIDLISFPHAFLSAPHGGALADLGPSISDVSQAHAVNNAGQVVGSTALGGSLPTALVTGPNGVPLPPGPFDAPYSGSLNGAAFLVARDINNHGQVLGHDVFGNAGFLTRPDGVTLVPLPYAFMGRVNDAGQVAYTSLDNQAYIWSEAEGSRMLAPEAAFSTAVDINNLGQVVGRADTSGYITAPGGGALSFLDTLGGDFTDPVGINNFGQVVGLSQTAEGAMHAFVTSADDGAMIDLENLDAIAAAGWSNLVVAAINDAGQIAGTGYLDGQRRAFFLSPVPETPTAMLLIAGLMPLVMAALKRKSPAEIPAH